MMSSIIDLDHTEYVHDASKSITKMTGNSGVGIKINEINVEIGIDGCKSYEGVGVGRKRYLIA